VRNLADLVVVDGKVVGNTSLKALCGATGSRLLPKGLAMTGNGPKSICPTCAALARSGR